MNLFRKIYNTGNPGAKSGSAEKRGARETPTDPEERIIIDRIAQDPMIPLDTLMADLVPEPFDIGWLSAVLLRLELSGRIRQLPGKTYVAV